MKKAQASVAANSEVASSAPVADDFPGAETQSSTSIKEDEEDDTPPFPSSLSHDVSLAAATAEAAESSPGGFGGACPHIPTSVIGSGHRKKALPHHSTHA